jgi:hypothetical protein
MVRSWCLAVVCGCGCILVALIYNGYDGYVGRLASYYGGRPNHSHIIMIMVQNRFNCNYAVGLGYGCCLYRNQ